MEQDWPRPPEPNSAKAAVSLGTRGSCYWVTEARDRGIRLSWQRLISPEAVARRWTAEGEGRSGESRAVDVLPVILIPLPPVIALLHFVCDCFQYGIVI